MLVVAVLQPLIATPVRAAPAITADPTSGPPATSVAVDGSDFTPGFTCRLYLTDSDQPPGPLVDPDDACIVAGNRMLTGELVVPNVAPGKYHVWACVGTGPCSDEFTERASVDFTVTTPPTTAPSTTQPPPSTTEPPPSTTQPPPSTTQPPPSTTQPPPSTTTTAPPTGTLPPIVTPPGTTIGPPPSTIGPLTTSTTAPLIALGGGACTVPATADVFGYDSLTAGDPHSILLGATSGSARGEVVVPAAGTASEPNGLLLRTDNLLATSPVERFGHQEDLRTGENETPPVHYVGFLVGLDSSHDSPVDVTLVATGRDAGGEFIVDVDRVVLGPDRTPVRECLLVRSDAVAEIRTVRVTSSEPGARIVIDDRFLGSEPHPDPRPPVVIRTEFLHPDEGTSFDAARAVPLLAMIQSPIPLDLGGDITFNIPDFRNPELDLTLQPDATSPWFGGGLGGVRMLVSLDVHLPPGEQRVEVAVDDERGTARADRRLTITGEPFLGRQPYLDEIAGMVDIVPWSMEITQAVRGPLAVQLPGSTIDDGFPMVANRRTVVRGYAVQQFAEGARPARVEPLRLSARLHGFRDGVELTGGPLNGVARLFEQTPGRAAEQSTRPYALYSFNFTLPESWTDPGDVTLELDVNPPGLGIPVIERDGAGGPANRIGRRTTFTEIGPASLTIYPVAMRSRCTDELVDLFTTEGLSPAGTTTGCASTDLNFTQTPPLSGLPPAIIDWWKWMPVAGLGPSPFTQHPTLMVFNHNSRPTDEPDNPSLPRALSGYRFDEISEAIHDLDCQPELERTKLSANGPLSQRVFLMAGGAPGFLREGCATLGRSAAFRSSAIPFVLAHEAGHAIGLQHSSVAHDEETEGRGGRQRWDGDHGELGPAGAEGWGFDVRQMKPIPPVVGATHVHDFMSYGAGVRWVAVDSWLAMFEAMRLNAPVEDQRDGARTAPDPEAGGEVGRVVAGVVAADGSSATIDVVELGAITAQSGDVASGLVLVAVDASGAVVAEVPVTLMAPSIGTGNRAWRADLSADVDAERLELRAEGAMLDETQSIGEPIAPALRVERGAADVDIAVEPQPGVSYRYEASRDGVRWHQLGVNDGEPFSVRPGDTGLAGDGWRVRVQASDGVGLVTDEVGDVAFGTPEPLAEILTPTDGAVVRPGTVVVAALESTVGAATRYRWRVDGELVGEGASAPLPLLAPGTQVIELEAKNAAGTSTAQITVDVAIDDDLDGLPDAWEADNGFDPDDPEDGAADTDGDGLATSDEWREGTDPDSIDSDGDRYTDDVELIAGSDPTDRSSVPVALLDSDGPPPMLEVDGAEPAPGEGNPAVNAGGESGGRPLGVIVAIVLLAIAAAIGALAFARSRRTARDAV